MKTSWLLALAVLSVSVQVQAANLYYVAPPAQPNDYVWATGVSNDGMVVGFVGIDKYSHPIQAYRWQAGSPEMELIPRISQTSSGSMCFGISDDGSVLGYEEDGGGYAKLYLADPQLHAALVTQVPTPFIGYAYGALSGDGRVVAASPNWRWDALGGVKALPTLGTGPSDVAVITRDGGVIAGMSSYKACCWTSQGIVALAPVSGSSSCGAEAITPDGAVAVGYATNPSDNRLPMPVLWKDGLVQIAPLPDGANRADFMRITPNGLTAFGIGSGPAGGDRGFAWDAVHGSRGIYQWAAEEYGLQLPLDNCFITAVSENGQYLAGLATTTDNSQFEAFVIVLPEPATALILLSAWPLLGRSRVRSLRRS